MENSRPEMALRMIIRAAVFSAFDIMRGTVETLYTECNGRQLRGPNDIVFDAAGGFWFTDFGKVQETQKDRCGVYYAKPDGSQITEMVFPIDGPNGVGLARDDTTLYVAQTFEGRVWQWDLAGPGRIRADGRRRWESADRTRRRTTLSRPPRLPTA